MRLCTGNLLPTILTSTLCIVSSGVDHSPPGEYGQNIPFKELQGGFPTGPPILPPHLLQVILNKEVSLQVALEDTSPICSSLFAVVLTVNLIAVRTDDASRTEPRHAEPPVRTLHKGTLSYSLLSLLSFLRKHVTHCNKNTTVFLRLMVPGRKLVARADSNLSRCRLLSGRCHGAQLDAPLPQEVRHDAAIQTHVMPLPDCVNRTATPSTSGIRVRRPG